MQRPAQHSPDGTPERLIYRALAFTEVVKANWVLTIWLRASFPSRLRKPRRSWIQDDELIVGYPGCKLRAGPSPDIAWRWVRDELDTMSTRPQDPFEISEEDKKTIREEIVPFWEGSQKLVR